MEPFNVKAYEFTLARILGRIHVATPAADVADLIRRRINRSKDGRALPAEHKEAIVSLALAIHDTNRDVYIRVMSGRL